MTTFVLDRVRTPRSVWNKGNGHVLTTDYESITVTLDKSLTAEEGTITINDGGLTAGQIVEVKLGFNDVKDSANKGDRCCPCDIEGCLHLEIPDPLPADVGAYLADQLRRYSMLIANTTVTHAAGSNTISYKMIRSGWSLEVSSDPASAISKAVTTAAANGSLPNIGDGSACFTIAERNLMTIPGPSSANFNHPGAVRPLKAGTGYASANPLPHFFGVLRAKDRWLDKCDVPCCVPLHDCPEAVRRGTIQIPLEEKASASYAAPPIVVARYLADGTHPNTGGFQILEPGTAIPTGMVLVHNGEIMMLHPNRDSAVLKLR